MVIGVGNGVWCAAGGGMEFVRLDEAVLAVPDIREAPVASHVAVGVVGKLLRMVPENYTYSTHHVSSPPCLELPDDNGNHLRMATYSLCQNYSDAFLLLTESTALRKEQL